MSELKNISIDTTVSFSDASFDDDRFIKGRIKVMHNKINPNNSNFDDKAIDDAKWSLSNIFVLANVVKDENGVMDFGAHDMRVEENKFDKNEGFKLIYDELPIGIIPQSNNYEYKKDKDNGKMYVYSDFLLVRDYSNYAEDIVKRYISEGKSIKVSMEVAIDDYKIVSNKTNMSDYYDVLKYRYLAVTMLGEKYGTGMIGAKIDFESKNTERINKCMEKLDELKTLFSCKKNEEDNVVKEVKELSIEEPKIKEEIVIDENFSDDQLNSDIEEELNNDEVIVDNFSVTARQKIKILSDSLEDTFEKDENGVCISSEHYWINTYDDDYVYLNRYSWSANGNLEDLVRAKYSIDEANMVASIDKTSFEVVFYQPITKEEKELLEDAKKVSELRMEELEKENLSLKESNEAFVKNEESLNIKVEEFVSTLAEKDVTIENLESFKLEVEKQISEMEAETFKAEADELIEEYTKDLNDVEEFEELKTKCYEMELTEIEDYCLKLVGKLNHKKVTKPKKQTKFNKSIVGLVADSKEEEKVLDDESLIKYGEYSQYLQKK